VKTPCIKEIKEEIYKLGAVYASMTGSGSSVYGLFKEKLTWPAGQGYFCHLGQVGIL
jgi:4-diphosphocytidyl-2-C-methyl-D-erythritol kinase